MSEGMLFGIEPLEPAGRLSNDNYRTLHPEYSPEVLPSKGEKLNIVINQERVDDVLETLLEQYENKGFPYNLDSTRLPHDPRHMPEELRFGNEKYGGIEHVMFLFTSCYYMRGGIKSIDAFKRLTGVYNERPDLFVCSEAMDLEPKAIASVLKKYGLGFQDTVSKQWILNARSLHDRFDGDPRNIFDEDSSYETSLEKIKNHKGRGFYGFQEKMTSMLIYYLMDEGMIRPFNFPIPVDLHVLRVSIANELITFPDVPHGTNLYRDETLETLRTIYFNYARDNDINPLRLCDAVWMLSESICGEYPGNKTIEPLGRGQRNGRSTILIPETLHVNDDSQRKAFYDSCGRCALKETCRLAIPGTQYYVGGNIIIRGVKINFPAPLSVDNPLQEVLFSD